MRNLTLITVILFALTTISHAAPETRGLRVVAKDPATGQSDEVKLYNKSYAVIIGIDSYKNLPRDRQLKNAVKDAKGVEAVLNKNYRFDKIISIYNQEATKDRILEVLTEELPAMMGDQDSLFLFWAGHGDQEKGAKGKEIGYLIPYDGEIGKLRKNLSMSELKSTISTKLPAKHVFYVMDACYGGLITSTRAVDKKSRRDLSYLKEITKENVRQALTAGGQGEEVLDGGPKGHSVFTGRLIEALEAAGDFITANEIQAIIREKVHGDSREQGKKQTPAFGILSGSGDYVFIPNIDQKVAEGAAELERMAKERKALEQVIAEANNSRDAEKRRRAEQEQERLKALEEVEKAKQAQLAREQAQQEKLKREMEAFNRQQLQQQGELARKKQEEEKHLEELKKLAATVAPSGSTASLAAAVAEIKRLSAEIDTLENRFQTEQTSARTRITGRYDASIADMKRQRQQAADTPLVKGEFEKESVFQESQKNRFVQYDSRIAELERQKRDELTQSEQTLTQALAGQTGKLKNDLTQLSEREYTVDSATLALELGSYDAEREHFPVTLASKSGAAVRVDVKGTVAIPITTAQQFKAQLKSGIVRPDIKVRAGDAKVIRIALANSAVVSDSDNYLMLYESGEFITIAEKKRRQEEERKRVAEERRRQEEDRKRLAEQTERKRREAAAAERALPIYIDSQSGLMWSKNGNIASKVMSWNVAMNWVKKLNYGGYSDWRLPTKDEFTSFSHRGGNRPSDWFNANGFDKVQAENYWSSTTTSYFTDSSAYFVSMYDGNTGSNFEAYGNYVWPVREGNIDIKRNSVEVPSKLNFKKGASFDHITHDRFDCAKCHDGEPGKISGFGKDMAHFNINSCKGCHQNMGSGPIKCGDCHKK
jgi:hypothetical protein